MPNGGTHLEHLAVEAERLATQEVQEDSLAKISRLAEAYKISQAEITDLEEVLKEKKKHFNKLSQELIPESMLAVGMTSIKLASGQLVSFKEELSASVKDYDGLYDFLEDRGDDALMKINLEIGKVPKNILAMIVKEINEKFGILATSKLFIHPMTLKSYLKKLCGIGSEEPGEVPLVELEGYNVVKTFTYYTTTVK